MPADYTKIDSARIRKVGEDVSNINNSLRGQLDECLNAINRLKSIWEGTAANETMANFNAFYKQYADVFQDSLAGYAKFLETASEAYESTEKNNVSLADAFKG